MYSQKTTKAEFPKGNSAFQSEFMRMVYAYTKIYEINSKITFVINIDEIGKMSNLKIYSKVRN